MKSLSAAFSQDRGSLVPVHRKESDLGTIWKRNIESALSSGSMAAANAAELDDLFSQFVAAYTAAIKAFAQSSVAAVEIEAQFHAYARLLNFVIQKAKGDRNRELFLKPLMSVGVVPVLGASPAAVIAPWNPLRMLTHECTANTRLTGDRDLNLQCGAETWGKATLLKKSLYLSIGLTSALSRGTTRVKSPLPL